MWHEITCLYRKALIGMLWIRTLTYLARLVSPSSPRIPLLCTYSSIVYAVHAMIINHSHIWLVLFPRTPQSSFPRIPSCCVHVQVFYTIHHCKRLFPHPRLPHSIFSSLWPSGRPQVAISLTPSVCSSELGTVVLQSDVFISLRASDCAATILFAADLYVPC